MADREHSRSSSVASSKFSRRAGGLTMSVSDLSARSGAHVIGGRSLEPLSSSRRPPAQVDGRKWQSIRWPTSPCQDRSSPVIRRFTRRAHLELPTPARNCVFGLDARRVGGHYRSVAIASVDGPSIEPATSLGRCLGSFALVLADSCWLSWSSHSCSRSHRFLASFCGLSTGVSRPLRTLHLH